MGLSRRARARIGACAATAAVGLLALSGVALATPPASQLANSTFEFRDGNLIVDQLGNHDWANASTLGFNSGADKQTGQTDDSFGQGTKEDTPIPTIVQGSIPNNKSDLTRFYIAHEIVNGNLVVYLAWERVQAPRGTTNIDFELNQSSEVNDNGPGGTSGTPVRTAGDVLIKYDLAKGGTRPVLGFHRWITSGNAQTDCEASNSLPCWDKVHALSSAAEADGQTNAATVTDPIAGVSLDPLTFGEAAVDLSAAGIVGSGCNPFAQAYVKSRSSDSFTAEVKDFILPISTNFNTCGDINIAKVDDTPAADGGPNPVGGATFTLYNDVGTVGTFEPGTDTSTGRSCETSSADSLTNPGTCSITGVPPGAYCIDETGVPPGYDATSYTATNPQCFTVTTGGTRNLTLVDPRQHRVIVLVCHMHTDTLAASDVTLGSSTVTSLAHGATLPSGITEAALCAGSTTNGGLGGAYFNNLSHGNALLTVNVGNRAH